MGYFPFLYLENACLIQYEWNLGVSSVSDADREIPRIMPETRLTEFPVLSVDLKVGISWSASETDD